MNAGGWIYDGAGKLAKNGSGGDDGVGSDSGGGEWWY